MSNCIEAVLFDKYNCGHRITIDRNEVVQLNLGLRASFNLTEDFEQLYTVPFSFQDAGTNSLWIHKTTHEGIKDTEFDGCLKMVVMDGCGCYQGELTITGHKVESGVCSITGAFIGGLNNFLSKLPNMRDLDLGGYKVVKEDIDEITAELGCYEKGITSQFWIGLEYYGCTVKQSEGESEIQPEYRRPQVYKKAILDAIEESTGCPIKSSFTETNDFKCCTVLGGSEDVITRSVRFDFTDDYTVQQSGTVLLHPDTNEVSIDNCTASWGADRPWTQLGDEIPSGTKVVMKACIILSGSSGNAVVRFSNFGEMDDINISEGKNELELCLPSRLLNRVQLEIIDASSLTPEILTGSYVEYCLEGEQVMPGNYLYTASTFDDQNSIEFLKGLQDTHNMAFLWDAKNKCVIAEPMFQPKVKGANYRSFFKGDAETVDWRHKVDCLNEEAEYIVSDYTRNVKFIFKEDSDDGLKPGKDKFSRSIVMSKKYPEGETEIENRFFSPTCERFLPEPLAVDENNIPLVPWIINYDYAETIEDPEADKSVGYKHCPRLLKKVGMVPGTWNNAGTVEASYPYSTQQSSVYGVNLTYEEFEGNTNLFDDHFCRLIEIYNEGVEKNITVKLDCTDINDLAEFVRTPKYFKTKTGETKAILFDPIIEVGGDNVVSFSVVTI